MLRNLVILILLFFSFGASAQNKVTFAAGPADDTAYSGARHLRIDSIVRFVYYTANTGDTNVFLINNKGIGFTITMTTLRSIIGGGGSGTGDVNFTDTLRNGSGKMATYYYTDSLFNSSTFSGTFYPEFNLNQLYNTYKYEPIKIPFPPGETLTAYTPHPAINRASPDSILITYKSDQTRAIYLGYTKDTGKTAFYIDTIMRRGDKTYGQTDVQEGIIVYGTDSIRVFPQCDSAGISSIGYVACGVNDKYNWKIADRPIYTKEKFFAQTGINSSYLSFSDYTITNDSLYVTLVMSMLDSNEKYRDYLLKAAPGDWGNLTVSGQITRPNAPFNDIYSSTMFRMSDSLWHMIYTQGAPSNGENTQKYHVKTAWARDRHGPWIQEEGIFMQQLGDSSWMNLRIYGVDILKDNETHTYLQTYKDSLGEYTLLFYSASGTNDRSSIAKLYLNTSKNDTNQIYVNRSQEQLNIYGRKRFLNELISSNMNAYKAKIGTATYTTGTKVYPVIVTSDSNKVQSVISIPVADVTGALSWTDTLGKLATDYDLTRKHSQGGDARGVNDTFGTKDNNEVLFIVNNNVVGKLTTNGPDFGSTSVAYSSGDRGTSITKSLVNHTTATSSTSTQSTWDYYQNSAGGFRNIKREELYYEGTGSNNAARLQINIGNSANSRTPALSLSYLFNQSVTPFIVNASTTYTTKTYTPDFSAIAAISSDSSTFKNFKVSSPNAAVDYLQILNNGVTTINAPVTINGSLTLSTTTSGFVPPRMTTAQRTALTLVEGLTVYDTDLHKLYVYDGTTWQVAW